MKTLIVISSCILLCCKGVMAETIATEPIPPYWYNTGFGSSEVYRGQTFYTPAGPAVFANNITVYFGSQTHSGARFRLLITEFDASSGFHPTEVLFESETVNIPFSFNSSSCEIDLGGLLLQPEHDYAWMLDYYIVGDPLGHVSMSVGLGSYPEDMGQGNYPDGYAFSSLPAPFYPTGTREEHFESNEWFVRSDKDYAFSLDYTPIPEPVSASLITLVCGGIYFVRRFFIV